MSWGRSPTCRWGSLVLPPAAPRRKRLWRQKARLDRHSAGAYFAATIVKWRHDTKRCAIPLRVQLQLNRREAHGLFGRCFLFANRGEFRCRDAEEIMNQASCLGLLSNAVLVWNILRIAEIVTNCVQGTRLLTRTSREYRRPFHAYVIPNDTHRFLRRGAGSAHVRRRELIGTGENMTKLIRAGGADLRRRTLPRGSGPHRRDHRHHPSPQA